MTATVIEVTVKRNKLVFTGRPTLGITNSFLDTILRTLYGLFDYSNKYEFQVSNTGQIGIKIENQISDELLETFKKIDNVCYLCIAGVLYKSEYFVDKINGVSILRSPITFLQTNDEIRYRLHELIKTMPDDNLERVLLVGGECYIFPKLLDTKQIDIYTDFMSIAHDSIINNPRARVEFVDYSTFRLDDINYDFAVLNVSKSGLGRNLALELVRISIFRLVYISCNKVSFKRDYAILSRKYSLINTWDYVNKIDNFVVSVYLFDLASLLM
jgi:hypothetical protein